MNIFKPRLRLVKGTRFVSFLFIGCSILIAAGILFAANMYYNIDTGEIVMEEIQRTTGLIRAIGGVIIGGTSTSTLPSGVALDIATSSAVLLSGENQLLRFSGGHPSYYTGFQATTSLTTSTVYVWPGTFPATSSYYLTVDPTTGEMNWGIPTGTGGSIFAVGDVPSGDAFTGTQGTTLWFSSGSNTGALTIASLSSNATYTLPAISGTNYLTLTSGNLGTGGVLFAENGLISTSTYFTWSTTSQALLLGGTGNAGQLRIHSGTNGHYLGFRATSTMAENREYYWPAGYGDSNYVLTTDGSGNLSWQSATGTAIGAVSGTGVANQVTYWTDTSTISGSNNFTWDGTVLSINGNITATGTIQADTSLIAPLITYAGGDLRLETTGSGDIILAPASGIVKLSGAGTHIETASGYKIGATGTEVLREMIPIMGFDLPVQTATTSYIQVSRTLEDYPFSTAATGTERIHKLVFRYAASTTADIDVQVATSSGAYSSFKLPQPETANLDKGEAYIATTTIPTDNTDWWVEIKTPTIPDTIRIFQIFLAAYDVVQ